jgi:hypothetical protein
VVIDPNLWSHNGVDLEKVVIDPNRTQRLGGSSAPKVLMTHRDKIKRLLSKPELRYTLNIVDAIVANKTGSGDGLRPLSSDSSEVFHCFNIGIWDGPLLVRGRVADYRDVVVDGIVTAAS